MVVLDDEDRENEGDLIINADKVTTEAMAFMVEHTSGVVSRCCCCCCHCHAHGSAAAAAVLFVAASADAHLC